MKQCIAALAALCLLAGCQTVYGPSEQKYDQKKCQALGYKNNPGLANCIWALYNERDQKQRDANQVGAAILLGAAVVGAAAVAANNQPAPRYWCNRYRCYYY